MPSFDTREPISATVDVVTGDVHITAGDVATTVVEVRPSDLANTEDVRMAEQTRVEYTNGALLVKAPKVRSWSPRSHGGSIDVTIELPAGSQLIATSAMADFDVTGRLGDVRLKSGLGRIGLDTAAALNVRSGAGDITVGHATGHADLSTGTGEIRVGTLDGSAVIKNSNGATSSAWRAATCASRPPTAACDRRRGGERGREVVERRRARRRGRARHGRARDEHRRRRGRHPARGTAAWLDAGASAGRCDNRLEGGRGARSDRRAKVEIRARTSVGDVAIRRAA